jgi:hypothetical protein
LLFHLPTVMQNSDHAVEVLQAIDNDLSRYADKGLWQFTRRIPRIIERNNPGPARRQK